MSSRSNTYGMPSYPRGPPPTYTSTDPSAQSSPSPDSRSFRPNRDVAQHIQIQIPVATPVLVRAPHIASLVVDTASVDSERPVPLPTKPPHPQERAQNNDAHIDIPPVVQPRRANSGTAVSVRYQKDTRFGAGMTCFWTCIAFLYFACAIYLIFRAVKHEVSKK